MSRINPKLIDQVFEGVEIPSDEILIEQVRRAKISSKKQGTKISEITREKMQKAAQEKALDPNWKKKMSNSIIEKSKDLDYQTKRQQGLEKFWSNPMNRQKHKDTMNSPDILEASIIKNRELSKDPNWKNKVTENNRNKRNNKDHIQNHQAAVTNRTVNNSEWIRKNCRPIKTPQGIFQRTTDAKKAFIKKYGGNENTIGIYMRRWLKDPDNMDFIYLTWEEYIKLTGNDPFNKS